MSREGPYSRACLLNLFRCTFQIIALLGVIRLSWMFLPTGLWF